MSDSESVLRGSYDLPPIRPPEVALEAVTQEEFERRCRAVQSRGNGLAGSVPYVRLRRDRHGNIFIFRGEDAPPAAP